MKIPIQKIGELANIELTPEEEARLSEELGKILAHVEQINSIPGLERVEPTSHPLSVENVFREDETRDQAAARDVLPFAPDREGDFFRVPKVIDND